MRTHTGERPFVCEEEVGHHGGIYVIYLFYTIKIQIVEGVLGHEIKRKNKSADVI